MGRKVNPEASYLEIEKQFYKSKGKIPDIKEVPFDVSDEKQSSSALDEKKSSSSSLDGLNLVRPVPKKGIKFQANYESRVPEMKKPSPSVKRAINKSKSSIPNVILRKPTLVNEDDVEDMPSRLRMKPNLSLKMRNEQAKENFSDMTLLRRPEAMSVDTNVDKKGEASSYVEEKFPNDGTELKTSIEEGGNNYVDFTLLEKPPQMSVKTNLDEKQEQFGNVEARVVDYHEEKNLKGEINDTKMNNAAKANLEGSLDDRLDSVLEEPGLEDNSVLGNAPNIHSASKCSIWLQCDDQLDQIKAGANEVESSASVSSEGNSVNPSVKFPIGSSLQEKPRRLDQSVKEREETVLVCPDGDSNDIELSNLHSTLPLQEHEDSDWARAEDLVKTGGRAEVELISSSTRGFVVSFGSLAGFLPYRNLAAKWKFLAFESWLRQKGLDPSMYKQNLGIIGKDDMQNKTSTSDSKLHQESSKKLEGEISPDMKLEDLLRVYDQEKLKFLSSFVSQKINVNVVMADRNSRKLIFSVRPKEKEELVEKKRSLMAKLRIGDVVKCCIKKITYFGVFVEVEGVPALIHQTEVSWDATLDPASYFKIGQVVEAKVHQIDFALERIFLSLKEITPDPLTEALESVVGGRDPLDGRLEAAQANAEWTDVESLIKELRKMEGIESVSKGRFFLSPGLAPTFQVYMASMFENQYKLLARAGNKVQEVIVQASLDKEAMKSTILSCTNRVE
ncbi:30S ribosomal S1 [Melia azedarach]|uniref:30S ribosomal S1 n=1 Tax=Melia azedarach TaxID=155640 RepID=A0ACC1XP18_MELAZ|nr:30S ribosomal S1 [Melia azedarach]